MQFFVGDGVRISFLYSGNEARRRWFRGIIVYILERKDLHEGLFNFPPKTRDVYILFPYSFKALVPMPTYSSKAQTI